MTCIYKFENDSQFNIIVTIGEKDWRYVPKKSYVIVDGFVDVVDKLRFKYCGTDRLLKFNKQHITMECMKDCEILRGGQK